MLITHRQRFPKGDPEILISMRKIIALIAAGSLAGLVGSTALAGGEACAGAKASCCATASANKSTANLKLDNIKCGECATKAETALMMVKGVTSAHVCPDSHVANVEFDKKQTSQRKIAAAAKKAGFKATVVKS